MTGHQINSLVGDLVAMAQAMERLPQVEAELFQSRQEIAGIATAKALIEADLEQSRTYAASLEAKVHAAEASRDDAELRFLELDERASGAAQLLRNYKSVLDDLMLHTVEDAQSMLNPPKPQPEPILSEVKPIQAEETVQHEPDQGSMYELVREQAPIHPPQGQSEADPTILPVNASGPDTNTHSIMDASVDGATSTSGASIEPNWTSPTPPKPQPYAGHNYYDWPAYVPYDKWIEGGGTHDDYYERRQDNRF